MNLALMSNVKIIIKQCHMLCSIDYFLGVRFFKFTQIKKVILEITDFMK